MHATAETHLDAEEGSRENPTWWQSHAFPVLSASGCVLEELMKAAAAHAEASVLLSALSFLLLHCDIRRNNKVRTQLSERCGSDAGSCSLQLLPVATVVSEPSCKYQSYTFKMNHLTPVLLLCQRSVHQQWKLNMCIHLHLNAVHKGRIFTLCLSILIYLTSSFLTLLHLFAFHLPALAFLQIKQNKRSGSWKNDFHRWINSSVPFSHRWLLRENMWMQPVTLSELLFAAGAWLTHWQAAVYNHSPNTEYLRR